MSHLPRTLHVAIFAVITCAGTLNADVISERETLDARYAQKLTALADQCLQQGLQEAAETTRGWFQPRQAMTLYVAVIPRTSAPVPNAETSEAMRKWHEEFHSLRRAQADELYALARQALKEKRPTLAWLWVHEAVRENPDHAAARRALGYQMHEGRWLTSFELTKVKSKQTWDEKFGWLPQDELERYQRGERFYRGRWVSEAEETELRSRIDRGWDVITEHFTIRTNHSLGEGVKLAEDLEKLSQAWHALFITFLASEREMNSWLDGKTSPRQTPPRHQVWYFRNKDEYVAALKDEQSWIANTTGYYDNDQKRSYLYYGLADKAHIFHEATHQLFAELRGNRLPVARKANFWIIEGIACYAESLVERNGFFEFGGTGAVRLNDARIRVTRDNYYEPLATLVNLGMLDLQRHTEIKKLYSQSAGLTWFLMHYDQGAYREAAIEYLIRIYAARDNPATLAELTKATYASLDEQYRSFMSKLPESQGGE